ncbi:hypothetical protein NHG97_29340 [Pseudomonas corrugata]|uniref:hypothetical protein n=1 Tax=Pseudomonas corrugata TaxID=47879 RepID=UPI0028C4231A|nr:hypothetical protein [Pseudomonas corrugata]MDU9042799.1 hypothetical protein [Pseudomonas corrugata]
MQRKSRQEPATDSHQWQLWFIAVVLVVVVGLLGYQLVDGLIRGVVVAYSRVGPSTAYSLAVQPKQYWFTMGGLAIVEIALVLLTAGTVWLAKKITR